MSLIDAGIDALLQTWRLASSCRRTARGRTAISSASVSTAAIIGIILRIAALEADEGKEGSLDVLVGGLDRFPRPRRDDVAAATATVVATVAMVAIFHGKGTGDRTGRTGRSVGVGLGYDVVSRSGGWDQRPHGRGGGGRARRWRR